jgi:hypothetical protein
MYDEASGMRSDYRWVILAHRGMLYKHRDWAALSAVFGAFMRWTERETERQRHEREVCTELYKRRFEILGWRPEDQLFIGV